MFNEQNTVENYIRDLLCGLPGTALREARVPYGHEHLAWTYVPARDLPRAASEVLGARLPYDTLAAVRARLAEASPVFARMDRVDRRGCDDVAGPAGDPSAMSDTPFALPITNYWQADVISRASETMAECARVLLRSTAPAAPMAAE